MIPMFVAISRGLNLQDIDFVLGGSSLNCLATRKIQKGDKYAVQRIQGTLVVSKHKHYVTDYSAPGFQFERLMTGANLNWNCIIQNLTISLLQQHPLNNPNTPNNPCV